MENITFDDIVQANADLDTVNIKGKEYVTVAQRVKAFRTVFPTGFINAELLSDDGERCLIRAEAGYYLEDGTRIQLGSGMAYEQKATSYINKTSYIENCETSAVGRALGFLGFGIVADIASAEELVSAINSEIQTAKKQEEEFRKIRAAETKKPENGTVTYDPMPKPAEPADGSVIDYLNSAINAMRQVMIPEFDFVRARAELIANGEVPNLRPSQMTMEQAKELINKIYAFFGHMMKGAADE